MKTFDEIKNILKEHKEMLKEKYKVKEIAIFGSYARDEQDDKSDVDIMVEFEEPVGFEFIHLADFLEELLGAKVDLTTKDSIKPNRWKYIDIFIKLRELREYAAAKWENPSLFKDQELTVFYYRSDNLSDEQKEKIIDFRNYDDEGKWYILLDEAK